MIELRLALRSLLRVPVFTAAVVVTIALGVGATTAVFSVVYGVLYRPLPYPQADRLVALWGTRPRNPNAPDQSVEAAAAGRIFVANTLLDVWRRDARAFEDIAGFRDRRFTITGSGDPVRVEGEVTTASFFNVLGLRPLVGRVFGPGEDQPGRDEVVVLGHAFWTDHFGGDRDIIGRTVRVDGRPHTVVGVLGADARLPLQYTTRQPAFYTPMSHEFTPDAPFSVLLAVARLKPGMTPAVAQAEMTAVMRHHTETTGWYRGRGVSVMPLSGEVVETASGTRAGLLILLAATGCVLLIGCVNVANLLLVRAATRSRELALRRALGAGRWRVIRQMMVESFILSTSGGLAGLLLAAWCTDLLVALMPLDLFPRIEEVHVDATVLAFGLAASLVVGLLAGLAPAWHAIGRDRRGALADALKDSQRAGAGGRGTRLLRRGLVTLEVVLAMVLLVGAGLLARTYVGLMEVDLGIRPERTLTFQLAPLPARYAKGDQRAALAADTLARLRAIGGVQAAGLVESLPIRSWVAEARVAVDGRPLDEHAPTVSVNRASDGFFEAAGVSLVSGALFGPRDTASDIAVVNHAFVRRFWPNASASAADVAGRTVRVRDTTYRIAGVVGDVKYRGPEGRSSELVYLPFSTSSSGRFAVILRTTGDPAAAMPEVRTAMRGVDPDLPLEQVQTLEQVLAETVAPQRFRLAVVGGFAGLALALAMVGLYGVIAQSVAQRTQEIGIRLALGAGQARIVRMVLKEGLLLSGLGVAGGIVVSLGATRVLSSFLFGVTPTDRATSTAVALALLAVAAAASLVPARRASAIEPVVALRNE
jgi:predicted permease